MVREVSSREASSSSIRSEGQLRGEDSISILLPCSNQLSHALLQIDTMETHASSIAHQPIQTLMKESKAYWNIKKEILSHLTNHHNPQSPLTKQIILKAISQINAKQQLKHLALSCLEKTKKRLPLEVDLMSQVENIRLKWCQYILMSYRTVTSKSKKDDQEEEEDESVNYVYDCLSFLDHIAKIKTVGGSRTRQLSIYMFPEDVITVPKFPQIKVRFDFFNSPDNLGSRDKEALYRQREKKARKLLDGDAFPNQIEAFLLNGCTNGERMQLYCKYFHIQSEQRSVLYLLQDAQKNPSPVDKIFVSDVSDLMNDSIYFIFRAEIKLCLKMFMRDKTIKDKIRIRPHTFLGIEDQAVRELPANQIIPSQLFAKYIAPFCYCSMKVDSIYDLFREFYCEYFCLLQSISSVKNSALYLCMLFEELLDTTERKIALHFSELGIKPLQVVFPWMFYCFVSYIDIQQIFYVFDRIIATKSLEILPLYAVSLLFKQKATILQLKSGEAIQEALHKSMQGDTMQQTVKYYLAYHL